MSNEKSTCTPTNAVKIDLSRADHTDHTVAALSVLNSLPSSLLLNFVTTSDIESQLLSCLQHESCRAIQIAAIDNLVDLLLRACYKLENVNDKTSNNPLKTKAHESIMHERRYVSY